MGIKDNPRVQKTENVVTRYIRWMFRGRYIRFFKILYTSIWFTALITFNISEFVTVLGGGYLFYEVYRIITEDGYEDESFLLNMGD